MIFSKSHVAGKTRSTVSIFYYWIPTAFQPHPPSFTSSASIHNFWKLHSHSDKFPEVWKEKLTWGFSRVPWLRICPASAGEMESIPALGRSHMVQISWCSWSPCTTTTVPELQSLQATTTEACVPGAQFRIKRSHFSEKPPDTRKSIPLPHLRQSVRCNEDPVPPKTNKFLKVTMAHTFLNLTMNTEPHWDQGSFMKYT